jgi:hypothetical protein
VTTCKVPEVPWILCPPWAPPRVAEQADRMYRNAFEVSASSEKLHTVLALATDSRMRTVWNELNRQRRTSAYKKGGSRLYAADLSQADFEESQRIFFRDIVHLRWQGTRTVRQSELADRKNRYLEMSRQLRGDFNELGPFKLLNEPQCLLLAAALYENMANAVSDVLDDPLVVSRQRTDPLIRGYALGVIRITQEHFGSPLYGAAAIICNVAFGCADLNPEKIRQLVRG